MTNVLSTLRQAQGDLFTHPRPLLIEGREENMISEKQLVANRANALKSTGPKSKKGKETASQNAVVHGLYSERLILQSKYLQEDKQEFEGLHESLREELRPVGVTQDYLVHKIASIFWRMRRVIAAETSYVNEQIEDISRQWKYRKLVEELVDAAVDDDYEVEDDVDYQTYVQNEVGKNSIPKAKFAETLVRYELRLDRQLTRTFRLLRTLQGEKRRSLPVRRVVEPKGDEPVMYRDGVPVE
ncbi:MAG: hypothetical protein DWP97_04765 [Calditrichaeota bacterium]|nr:MAG: hypothetical protein DWP97_04765 [Calditrichota bacterium]